MHRLRLVFGILSVVADFAAVSVALLAARALRSHGDFLPFVQFPTGFIPSVADFLPFALSAAALFVALLAIEGAYDLRSRPTSPRLVAKVLAIDTVWLMLLFSYFYLTKDAFFSRIVLVNGAVFSFVAILTLRGVLAAIEAAMLRRGYGRMRVALVGPPEEAQRVRDLLELDRRYVVVGTVSASSPSAGELEVWCTRHAVDEVIQVRATPAWPVARMALFCATRHLGFRSIPDVWMLDEMGMQYEDEGGIPMIRLRTARLEGWGRVIKRLFDTAVSALLIVVLSPLLLVVALAVRLSSPGPVLFRQIRVGYRGQPFPCFKFRSMVENAEELKAALLSENERSGPLFKIKRDPRVTPIGRILRRTSLDELPQLFNVFLGHMSLVGPRPHLPEEVERYREHQRLLLSVKPGMTGMAQVNGRSAIGFDDEVRLDMYYVRNWSFWTDIRLLFRTAWVVLMGRNAD